MAPVGGRDAVLAFYWEFAEFFEGTFAQEIVDVMASEKYVVMLVHETGRKGDAVFDNRAVYLIHLRDDRWTAIEILDRDREAAARFYAAVGAPGAALNPA